MVGGTHIWKWCTSATKHLRCRGLSVTNWVTKGGSFSDKAHKNRGSFSEMHKKIGAFRAKMAKNFSTFRQICQNFRKNPICCRKLSLVWLLHAKIRDLWMTKMCQGLSVTRSLLKIGGHWVKVGKNRGSFGESERKKVGTFSWYMARNSKLSAPRDTIDASFLHQKTINVSNSIKVPQRIVTKYNIKTAMDDTHKKRIFYLQCFWLFTRRGFDTSHYYTKRRYINSILQSNYTENILPKTLKNSRSFCLTTIHIYLRIHVCCS